ncbi:DUF5677 domain-containing protein [Scleromatobacter humisilvae]|uniref:DUF5677 domain-containing protein n=1 Tax=Scleromatobacter humisilvae TaxID=2897159 RepID=A0A9X2C170_9BURK|nr:DUF5677 domain-containing protein [Scleromatobacter humisilvae]MCK9687947.1 DUF5677 domain-containing protein [Scleromatobacter humisilvae]
MTADITSSDCMFDDLQLFRQIARQSRPVQFTVSDNIVKLAVQMLRGMPPMPVEPHILFAWKGFAKALQAFKACVLLCEAGAIGEASAMARITAECTIVGTALAREKLTLAAFLEANDKHWKPLAEQVSELITSPLLSEKGKKGFNQAQLDVDKFKQAYPDKGPNSFRVEQLAREVDLSDLYLVGIRFPSGDGAHATKDSFNAHTDPLGIAQLTLGPTTVGLKRTMMIANLVGSFMLRFAAEDLGMTNFKEVAERAMEASTVSEP